MQFDGKIVVVTGAGAGIGAGLAKCFTDLGAIVVCVDINQTSLTKVAGSLNAHARYCDVASEASIKTLIEDIETNIGPIDLFCANAGILTLGGFDTPDDDWERIWKVNTMSHVWTARHMVPRMLERGGGYFLITASAAGLLNQPGAAPYAVSKHAAVGFAEWLSLSYGDMGIGVSVLCPQAVRSEMTKGHEESVASLDGMLEPEDVAQACVEAITTRQFLVLPHPQVLDYMRLKTSDYDRWLGGMRKLNRAFASKT